MHHLDRRKTVRGPAVIALLTVLAPIAAGLGLGYAIGGAKDRMHAQPPNQTAFHLPSPAPSAPAFLATPASPAGFPERGHLALDIAPAFIAPPAPVAPSVLSPLDRLADLAVARLGAMQAELARLNALGERLARDAGLDPAEFDFARPPALGGPEIPAEEVSIRDIVRELSGVVGQIQARQQGLQRLEARRPEAARGPGSSAGIARYATLPDAWPVRTGYISSTFGPRIHPNRRTRSMHTGVDFAGPRGTPILAVADGVVIFDGRHGAYGRTIDIRHADGVVTRYAHNERNLVREGDRVRRGQQIATLGISGNATGPHLHFEVIRDGKPVDPMLFLEQGPRTRLARR